MRIKRATITEVLSTTSLSAYIGWDMVYPPEMSLKFLESSFNYASTLGAVEVLHYTTKKTVV